MRIIAWLIVGYGYVGVDLWWSINLTYIRKVINNKKLIITLIVSLWKNVLTQSNSNIIKPLIFKHAYKTHVVVAQPRYVRHTALDPTNTLNAYELYIFGVILWIVIVSTFFFFDEVKNLLKIIKWTANLKCYKFDSARNMKCTWYV